MNSNIIVKIVDNIKIISILDATTAKSIIRLSYNHNNITFMVLASTKPLESSLLGFTIVPCRKELWTDFNKYIFSLL